VSSRLLECPYSDSTPHSAEEKWVFKGKAELVDLEVVPVGGIFGNEDEGRQFEVLSPEGSFAVYAGTSLLSIIPWGFFSP